MTSPVRKLAERITRGKLFRDRRRLRKLLQEEKDKKVAKSIVERLGEISKEIKEINRHTMDGTEW